MPYHVFSEATAVGMSAAKSDHEYKYKTEFKIWRESKEFEGQSISMSRPRLDLTTFSTDMTNVKISHLNPTPVGAKTKHPKPLTQPTELSKSKKTGKRVRAREPVARPIIFRLIIKRI